MLENGELKNRRGKFRGRVTLEGKKGTDRISKGECEMCVEVICESVVKEE